MKVLIVLCVVLAMSCSALGASEESQAVVVRSRRDLMEHSVNLIHDLAANLQKAAEEALDAVARFAAGIVTEAERIRDKVLTDIEAFRNRISAAIDTVFEKVSNTSTSVRGCVESHRDQASHVFEETVSNTMLCVDEHIAVISTQISELKTLSNEAIAQAAEALENMKTCTHDQNGIFNTGSCLGVLAVQTEVKTLGFMAQSALMIGRINLSITLLPVTMEVCAGTHIIQAGIQTGKIVMDIGSCSASAIFNNFTSNV